MKNLLIIFMALATFAVHAQDKNLKKSENHKEMYSKLTPEQRMDFKVKKMTSALDLTTEQQEKIKELFLTNKTEHSKRYKNKREMTDAEKAGAKKAMLDKRMALKTEMSKILTEEQVKKWEEIRSEKRSLRKDARKGLKNRSNFKKEQQD